jgi:hypothetical protein
MTRYQATIQSIDPTVNARHVEGFMRLQYGTLDHLSRARFVNEIKMFKAEYTPANEIDWERNAKSYGL